MKIKIQIPEPLPLTVDGVMAPEKMTFSFFIRSLLDNDPRMNESGAAIRASVRIDTLISAAKPGEVVEFEEDDHKLLSDVVEKPQGGYPGLLLTTATGIVPKSVARQLLPFIDAMQPVKETPKPEPKAKAEKRPS